MGYQNADQELQEFLINRNILSREDVYFAMNYQERLPDKYKRNFKQVLLDLDFLTAEELDYTLETHGYKLSEQGHLILLGGDEIVDVSVLDDILDDPPGLSSEKPAAASEIELHIMEGGERKVLSANESESAEMVAAAMEFYEQQFLQPQETSGPLPAAPDASSIPESEADAMALLFDDPIDFSAPIPADPIHESEESALAFLFDDPPPAPSPTVEEKKSPLSSDEEAALAALFDEPFDLAQSTPAPVPSSTFADSSAPLDLAALFNESPIPAAEAVVVPEESQLPAPLAAEVKSEVMAEADIFSTLGSVSPEVMAEADIFSTLGSAPPEVMAEADIFSTLGSAPPEPIETEQILVPRHTVSEDVLQSPQARRSDTGAFEVIIKEGGAQRIMSASEEESAEMIEQAMKFYHQQFFANDMVASYNSKTHGDDEINAILMQFPDAMRAQAQESANQQPMGQILLKREIIEEWQLVHALCLQKMENSKKRLGDILVELNYTTSERIEAALAQHH